MRTRGYCVASILAVGPSNHRLKIKGQIGQLPETALSPARDAYEDTQEG